MEVNITELSDSLMEQDFTAMTRCTAIIAPKGINYLFARFDENYINIVINDITVKTINDVKETLGGNYQDKNYDKEQHLNEYVFEDKDTNIKAEFIYSTFDDGLLWIILSR